MKPSLEEGKRKMDVQGEVELQGREMDSALSKRENMICTS